jgi:hypothetical protein
MKYAVEMGSVAMIPIPGFLKIVLQAFRSWKGEYTKRMEIA